jgi:hypothetical protein
MNIDIVCHLHDNIHVPRELVSIYSETRRDETWKTGAALSI